MHALVHAVLLSAACSTAAEAVTGQNQPSPNEELASTDSDATAHLPQLIADLESNDPKARARAAIECARLGPKAAPAAAALVAALGDERHAGSEPDRWMMWAHVSKLVQDYAAEAIAAIGPSTVPALIEAFETGNEDTRDGVVKALRRFGADAKAALPALRRALDDPDWEVRVNAVEGLGALGPAANEAFPKLAGLSQNDPQYGVRFSAVEALSRIEPDVAKVMVHLVRLLDDEDPDIREWALKTLVRRKPDPKAFVPVLIRALEDRSADVRAAAVEALASLGPEAKPAALALVGLLDDDALYTRLAPDVGGLTMHGWQFPVRELVPEALGKIGPGARAALPALLEFMRTPDHVGLQLDAAVAVRRIDPQNEEPISFLVAMLERNEPGEDLEYRGVTDAAETLAELGPLAAPAVSALAVRLEHKDDHVRWSAAGALGEIGPAAKEALPALIRVMRDDESWIADRAAKAILSIDPGNVEARARIRPFRPPTKPAALFELLDHDDPVVRAAACKALADLDEQSAVPKLISALQDESPVVRAAAARALGEFGRLAEAAVHPLREALGAKQNRGAADVCREAATALGRIGPAAAAAESDLINLRYDEDPDVRKAASEALQRIQRER